MVVMEASMVRLPYAANLGKGSMLHTLVESSVPVQAYGSETVKAIIHYKWQKFAKWKIFTKAVVSGGSGWWALVGKEGRGQRRGGGSL